MIQSPDVTGHITKRYEDPEEAAQARLWMPPFEMSLIVNVELHGRKVSSRPDGKGRLQFARSPEPLPKP